MSVTIDSFSYLRMIWDMNTEQVDSQLNQTGLSDKEAAVYAALLELGGGFPSRIAEHAKIKRSTAYKVLLDLSVKGLANEIRKRNKVYYQPERPEKLIRYAKNRIRLAEDQLENTEKIVPKLTELFSSYDQRPKIRFYEGQDAVLTW